MSRQIHIDALKIIASQLIVFHHFSAYGPLSDAMGAAAPALSGWLYDYARMAVQVFLVIGGYLAIRSLAPQGQYKAKAPLMQVAHRYLRLTLPFVSAMLLAMLCSLLARQWLAEDFIPAAPTGWQFLSHVLLLHSVTDADSLSAGAWYVAIDFQLYLLLTLLLCAGRTWAVAWVMGWALASLLFFNRHPELDVWAIYFIGSYGLGVLAFWAGESGRPKFYLCLLGLVCIGALLVEFRARIAVATVVAIGLGLMHRRRPRHQPDQRDTRVADSSAGAGSVQAARWQWWIEMFARSAYALFLVHFSVLMLANALFAHFQFSGSSSAAAVLAAGWLLSICAAMLFERWVERPLSSLQGGIRVVRSDVGISDAGAV